MSNQQSNKHIHNLQQAFRDLYPGRFSAKLSIQLLPEQGWFNQTYLLKDETLVKPLVLRTRKASAEQQRDHSRGIHWSPYFKEAWAIQTAHLGVPVAAIDCHDVGYLYVPTAEAETPELFAFLLQEYLPFDTAAAEVADSQRSEFFEHIGTIARQINATPTRGFGCLFQNDTSSFLHSSWEEYLEHEIEQFTQIIGNSARLLSKISFEKACARIRETKSLASEGTLYHLDFVKNWNNILVDEYRTITGVIDWEFAGSGPATHCELASTLYVYYRDNASVFERRKEFSALLAGYGLSLRAYASNFRYDVESLVLKHCLAGIARCVAMEAAGTLHSQPWRKVQAERAAGLAELILLRNRPTVYVSNPVARFSSLAA